MIFKTRIGNGLHKIRLHFQGHPTDVSHKYLFGLKRIPSEAKTILILPKRNGYDNSKQIGDVKQCFEPFDVLYRRSTLMKKFILYK